MHTLKAICPIQKTTTPSQYEALNTLLKNNPFHFVGADDRNLYKHLSKLESKGLAVRKGYQWYPTIHGIDHYITKRNKLNKIAKDQTKITDFTKTRITFLIPEHQTITQEAILC